MFLTARIPPREEEAEAGEAAACPANRPRTTREPGTIIRPKEVAGLRFHLAVAGEADRCRPPEGFLRARL